MFTFCVVGISWDDACHNCIYLGHIVGGGEVRPMDCKVLAVKEYERPQTKKQVRVFLGLCGYYRWFIPSYFTLACPLTELTKKNKENVVKWTEARECAFNSLKEVLTSKPVLTTPDGQESLSFKRMPQPLG